MPRDDSGGVPFRFVAAIVAAFAAAVLFLASWQTLETSVRDQTNFGYTPNPEGTRTFLRELRQPTFAQAAAESVAKARGVDTFLYRYADKAHRAKYGKPFTVWNQGAAGTCVSFAWGLGSYIGQSVDWANGELPEPPLLVATEPIYGGSRTLGRQPPVTFAGFNWGSYGAAAARWVNGTKDGRGGILYRQKYGSVDLSEYSIPLSRDWGAYGVPDDLAKLANERTARSVALVEDWDSLCASVEAGWCVAICSNVGFAASKVRSPDGFLKRGGTWNHAMLICGIRHASGPGGKDGALVANSWGENWLDEEASGRWPADQPRGTFWISRADAESILAQGDSFSIAGVNGFRWRTLNHRDWMAPAAPSSLSSEQPRTDARAFALSQ